MSVIDVFPRRPLQLTAYYQKTHDLGLDRLHRSHWIPVVCYVQIDDLAARRLQAERHGDGGGDQPS